MFAVEGVPRHFETRVPHRTLQTLGNGEREHRVAAPVRDETRAGLGVARSLRPTRARTRSSSRAAPARRAACRCETRYRRRPSRPVKSSGDERATRRPSDIIQQVAHTLRRLRQAFGRLIGEIRQPVALAVSGEIHRPPAPAESGSWRRSLRKDESAWRRHLNCRRKGQPLLRRRSVAVQEHQRRRAGSAANDRLERRGTAAPGDHDDDDDADYFDDVEQRISSAEATRPCLQKTF